MHAEFVGTPNNLGERNHHWEQKEYKMVIGPKKDARTRQDFSSTGPNGKPFTQPLTKRPAKTGGSTHAADT